MLAVFDPIGELALQDKVLFEELTKGLRFASNDVQRLLDELKRIPDDYAEEAEDFAPAASNATLKIGDYQERVPRAVFLAWRETMYEQVGMNEKDIQQEMKWRLDLCD